MREQESAGEVSEPVRNAAADDVPALTATPLPPLEPIESGAFPDTPEPAATAEASLESEDDESGEAMAEALMPGPSGTRLRSRVNPARKMALPLRLRATLRSLWRITSGEN